MNFLAAALYAVASSVLIALVLGFYHSGLTAMAALIALCGGFVIGTFGWWRGRGAQKLPRPGGWAIAALVLFALISLRAFLWLIFREGDELRVLSPNNLGDMSLHLTFLRYLANGAPFWPDSPIFSAGKLTYSVGMDFFNALLSLMGVSTERGLIWTGLLGALATGIALLRWGGAFTVVGFLCNGGLAALAWFASGPDLPLFRDYQAEWAWKSLPLSILVTQRGFLFALPAGLLLLTSWRTRFFQDGKGWSMPFLGELLLYAAMPFFHLHTFLALSFLLAAFLIARPAARLQVARLIAAAFLPATALLYLTVGMFKTNAEPMWEDMSQFENPPGRPPVDAIGWQPGWMVNDATTADIWQHVADANPAAERFASHGKFLIFWFGNFGVLPLLLVPFAIALLHPVFPRGPSHRAGWAWFAIIVVITPFLGAWSGYREKSLGALLTGGGEIWDLRAAAVPLLALAAALAATRLPRVSSRDFGLRQALFATSGVLMLDALFTALHTWDPHIPLLRADATPLLLATYAFIVLLWRMSQQPGTGWPALIGLPALFLFFVCCNIRFARWDWDNTKMMLWCWVIVLAALWEALLVRWNPWLRTPVCALLFFSGFLSVLGGIDGSHSGYAIGKLSTIDAVAQAVRDIPITEPFAAQPTYNHPLLLCGRKVVMGYDGHLSSHGIQYGPVEDDLNALMRGFPDWRLRAARLGVRYLFFGPGERATWPESHESWRMSATVIAAGEWGEILDLETPPLPVDETEAPTLRLAPPRLQPPSPQP
jgi:hypothetical protein